MTDKTKTASEPPLDCQVGRPECAEWLDAAFDETGDARRSHLFEAGCISRGLCPMCIASGTRGDCALDMLGSCAGCGYMTPNS